MSNLGAYQWMTSTAKKVGGPKNFIGLIAFSGAGIYKLSEIAVKQCVKAYRNHKSNKRKQFEPDISIYTVTSPGESNEGVVFNQGDKFRVLEIDDEAVLIEKIGDPNNPYFVSANFLNDISNFNL